MLPPPEFDIHSENHALINAALAAGLYPKILRLDPMNGQFSTVTNSQAVFFHPSSVNFKRKPQDFGVNHLAFFTIMSVSVNLKAVYKINALQALKEIIRLGDGPGG